MPVELACRGRTLSRRGDHIVGPLFSRGFSLAGRFLGEYSRLQRRIGLDHDLRNGTLPLGRSVKRRWLRDRLPRSVIRACSALVRIETLQSCAMPLSKEPATTRSRLDFFPPFLAEQRLSQRLSKTRS